MHPHELTRDMLLARLNRRGLVVWRLSGSKACTKGDTNHSSFLAYRFSKGLKSEGPAVRTIDFPCFVWPDSLSCHLLRVWFVRFNYYRSREKTQKGQRDRDFRSGSQKKQNSFQNYLIIPTFSPHYTPPCSPPSPTICSHTTRYT